MESGIADEQMILYMSPDGSINMNRADTAAQAMLTDPTATGSGLAVTSGFSVMSCTTTGQVVWDTVTSMDITSTPSSCNVLTLTSGVRCLVGNTANVVVKKPDNTFGAVATASLVSGESLVPVSRTLPVRVAYQGKTFSVVVELSTSATDTQMTVPVYTNTWGQLHLPYVLLSTFQTSTTDVTDQAAFDVALAEGVTHTHVESLSPVDPPKTSNLYRFNTVSGNFMLNNGVFVSTASA